MTDPEQRLPCGTDQSALLEHIADDTPLPEHSATCPYCQAALAELRTSWATVRTATTVPTPPPAGLVSRVMSRVAAERGAGAGSMRRSDQRGTLRIDARAVVTLARVAALTVPGVQVRAGIFDDARLTLELALHRGAAFSEIEPMTRARVIAELSRSIGLPPPPVDIRIVDVW